MEKKFNLKNIIKTTYSYILYAILLILLGTATVYAEDAPSSLTMKYRNYTPPISFPQTFHIKETVDGKYVYCMTYAKNMPITSIKYTRESKYTDPGINYILEQGYKAKTDKEYFVAQTAAWIYLIDKGDMDKSATINTFKSNIANSSNTYATQIKNLVATAKKQTSYNQSKPTISLSDETVTFTLSGDKKYYVSNEITVKSSQSDYKVELSGAPKGTTYTNNNGKIVVKIPVESVTHTQATFSIKVINTKTIYISYKYKPSNSKYQVMSATYPQTLTASDAKEMSIVVDKIVISKQDITTKEELPGATLVIKNSAGEVVEEWQSTNEPKLIDPLPVGTYTLTETIQPEGYDLSTETITFEVTNKGIETKVIMYNTPSKKVIPKLSISKVDSDSKDFVEGATLQILDKDGNVVRTIKSENKATIIENLPAGTYTLIETEAPEGYLKSDEKVEFTITEGSEETVYVTFTNKKKPTDPPVEIEVPSTSSFKSLTSSMIGLIIIVAGSVLVTKNLKKKNEI